MKNDQEGEQAYILKRLFANPFKPEICSFLALGLYLITYANLSDKLFPGSNQGHHFLRNLHEELSTDTGQHNLIASGLTSADDLSAHSYRKAAQSFVMNGTTAPPSQSSCDIRAGYSQGKVRDIYLKQIDVGDCFVGRSVAALPSDSERFCILPAHFRPDPQILQLISRSISCIVTNCQVVQRTEQNLSVCGASL